MAIEDGTGWVVATDSGYLLTVDLGIGKETRAVDIGSGGSHVVAGEDGAVFVGRYNTGGTGEHLVIVDTAGSVGGVATSALGGLAAGEDGTIWALEKADAVLQVDPVAKRVLARAAVDVDDNTHMELVAGGGARWVSSDATPVRRISGDAKVVATIETGGGIPLAFAGGLVWGARADELWAIDPATNAVSQRVPLVGIDEILALDVSGTEAWIAARRPGRVGTVVRLELPTGRVVAEYPVSLPAAVELAPDRAWVTSYDTNEVLGYDR